MIDNLLEHTHRIVRHCGDQQDCGLGEIPSLPKLVPKILTKIFVFLNNGELIALDVEVKDRISQSFETSKTLLTAFLNILDEIKIRTVLEDELELLVLVIDDLLGFHDVLIPLDFKLTCMVWKLYLKLTTKYQTKLVDKVDLGRAADKVSAELTKQFLHLRHLLTTLQEDRNINKEVTKVAYLLKVVQTAAAQALAPSPAFLSLLEQVFLGLPDPPAWVPDVARKKIISDVTSPNIKHMLTKFASKEPFLSFFMTSVDDMKRSNPKIAFKVISELITLNPGKVPMLLDHCLEAVSQGGLCLLDPPREGRQVRGCSVAQVDPYTWTLTQVCAQVAAAGPEQFRGVERVLVRHLLAPASSAVTLLLVSDMFSFLARYSTSRLCLAHLTLLHAISKKLSQGTVSLNQIFVELLQRRLVTFLSPVHKKQWASLTGAEEMEVEIVVDCWSKLVSGSYTPMKSVSSAKNLSSLVEATLKKAGVMTAEQRSSILRDVASLVNTSSNNAVLITHASKIINAFHSDEPSARSLKESILTSWRELSPGKRVYRNILKDIAPIFKDDLPETKCAGSKFNGDSTSKCSTCCKWSGEKAVLFSTRVSGSGDSLQRQSTVEMLAGETSDSGSESRSKKRRLSGDRGHVAEAVKRVKRELEILLLEDKSSLVEYKDSISDIEIDVEKLLKKIR